MLLLAKSVFDDRSIVVNRGVFRLPNSTKIKPHFIPVADKEMPRTPRLKKTNMRTNRTTTGKDDAQVPPKTRSRSKTLPKTPEAVSLPLLPLPPVSHLSSQILPRDFFEIDALDLAPRLLGKFLRREEVVLQITEVEAYRPNDTACHGRFGITARTAPVFGPGGHAYVYLCYGLHTMLNIVADKNGVGAAVLIRSCAPVSGLDIIQQRRGQKTEKPVLLSGPGKVAQALGLSTSWSNHSLYTAGGLEVLEGPEPEEILTGPRVGIEYASPDDVNAPWRFAIAGSPWISAPKNTLRLPSF